MRGGERYVCVRMRVSRRRGVCVCVCAGVEGLARGGAHEALTAC